MTKGDYHMETTNLLADLEIETIDLEVKSPEELLAELQQYIFTALPQLFRIYQDTDGNKMVHCLNRNVRETLGNLWYEIIRDFINLDFNNLEDEELEIAFLHILNHYLRDGITRDNGAWGYWLVRHIEAEVMEKARKKSDFEIFWDGLYKYFDADDLPDGSFTEIERFRPGIVEQLGDTWRQIVEEFFLLGEEEELDWQDIDFRFWRHLNMYAHEGGCFRDDGRWGAWLMQTIESALSRN